MRAAVAYTRCSPELMQLPDDLDNGTLTARTHFLCRQSFCCVEPARCLLNAARARGGRLWAVRMWAAKGYILCSMAERWRSVRLHLDQLLRFNAAGIAQNPQVDAAANAKSKTCACACFFLHEEWLGIFHSAKHCNARLALRRVACGIILAYTEAIIYEKGAFEQWHNSGRQPGEAEVVELSVDVVNRQRERTAGIGAKYRPTFEMESVLFVYTCSGRTAAIRAGTGSCICIRLIFSQHSIFNSTCLVGSIAHLYDFEYCTSTQWCQSVTHRSRLYI